MLINKFDIFNSKRIKQSNFLLQIFYIIYRIYFIEQFLIKIIKVLIKVNSNILFKETCFIL